jgi:hypothetical protein
MAYNEIKGERMLACSQALRHLFFGAEMPQEVGSFGAANAADEFCPNSTGRDFCFVSCGDPICRGGVSCLACGLHSSCLTVTHV